MTAFTGFGEGAIEGVAAPEGANNAETASATGHCAKPDTIPSCARMPTA